MIMNKWWLSFADPNLPKGTQFLGVVIIECIDIADGVAKAHSLGINPGGEVKGIEIPGEVTSAYCNKLLSKKEMEDLGLAPVRWVD